MRNLHRHRSGRASHLRLEYAPPPRKRTGPVELIGSAVAIVGVTAAYWVYRLAAWVLR